MPYEVSAWYPARRLPLGHVLRGRFGHLVDNVAVRIANRSLLAWLYAPRPRGQRPIPTVLLRATGRKTGTVRTKIIPAYRQGDRFVLSATNHGNAADPYWLMNLVAHPSCRVLWRWRWRQYVARVAEGDERAELAAEIGPVHGPLPYFARIASGHGRTIPLVVLEPLHRNGGRRTD